jgi:hypothetical protein
MKEMGRSYAGLKITTYASLVLNALAIALSLIGDYNVLNIAGYIYFAVLCINLSAIFFTFINLNVQDKKGKILKVICYIFLVFFFFALFLLLYKQIIFVTIMDLTSIQYIVADLIQKTVYFGILGFGVILALLDLKYLHRPETWIQ